MEQTDKELHALKFTLGNCVFFSYSFNWNGFFALFFFEHVDVETRRIKDQIERKRTTTQKHFKVKIQYTNYDKEKKQNRMTNSNRTEKRKPWKIRIRIRTCLSGFGLWRKNDRHKSILALSVFYSSRIHLTVNPMNLKSVIRWIIVICYHGRGQICQSYCFLCGFNE